MGRSHRPSWPRRRSCCCGNERKHRIEIADEGELLRISGIVARRGTVSAIEGLSTAVWIRNRSTTLVGFRIDSGGRLVGETALPTAGLTADELQFAVRHLATECDCYEYQLTGKDAE